MREDLMKMIEARRVLKSIVCLKGDLQLKGIAPIRPKIYYKEAYLNKSLLNS
jgi:hypothetical protein